MHQLANQREHILGAMPGLIAAGGHKGYSYADVAARAGIGAQQVQHHFPSKRVLLTALVAHQRTLTAQWIAQVQQGSADPAQLLRLCSEEWARAVKDPGAPFCLCAVLAAQLTALPEDAASAVRSYFEMLWDWVGALLERGAAEGSLRLAAPAAVEARIFIATLQGAMLSARAYDDDTVFRAIAASQLARF